MCASRPVPDLARVLAGIVLSLLVWDQQGHSLHILSFFHSPVKNIKFHTGSDLSITFYVVDNPSDGSYIRLTAPLSVRGNRLMCMARLSPSAVGFNQVLLVNSKACLFTFCNDLPHPSPGEAKIEIYRYLVTFVALVLLVSSDGAELVSAATMGPFTHYLRAVVLLHLLNNFWWQSTCSHFICALGFVIGSRLFHCRSTIYSSPWCLGAKTSTAPELPTMCGVHFFITTRTGK